MVEVRGAIQAVEEGGKVMKLSHRTFGVACSITITKIYKNSRCDYSADLFLTGSGSAELYQKGTFSRLKEQIEVVTMMYAIRGKANMCCSRLSQRGVTEETVRRRKSIP